MVENNLIAKTSKGKEIRIAPAANISGFHLKFYPGGQMPKMLKGIFTSRGEAERAVDVYIRNYDGKSTKKAPSVEEE